LRELFSKNLLGKSLDISYYQKSQILKSFDETLGVYLEYLENDRGETERKREEE
jgi:hypothetical protein